MQTLYVFDIDGTVLDSIGIHQCAFLKALNDLGFDRIDTDWDAYTHHTDSWIFRENFIRHRKREPTTRDLIMLDRRIAENLAEMAPASAIVVTDGFDNFVHEVIGNGDAVAFATGSMRQAAQKKLILAEVAIDAPLITASEYFEREHIVAAAVAKSAHRAGIKSFSRVICFGDGRWDLVAAQKLGFEFVGITAFSSKLEGLIEAKLLHNSFHTILQSAKEHTST